MSSGTSRVTTDYDTLKAQRDSGCRLLIVGYESGDPQVLKNVKKGATVERARNVSAWMVRNEGRVWIFNDRGEHVCHASLNGRARKGVVVGLGIWWRKLGENGTNVNQLTHQQLTDDEQASTGVTEDLIRLSIGIEDVEDILADLEHAFAGL